MFDIEVIKLIIKLHFFLIVILGLGYWLHTVFQWVISNYLENIFLNSPPIPGSPTQLEGESEGRGIQVGWSLQPHCETLRNPTLRSFKGVIPFLGKIGFEDWPDINWSKPELENSDFPVQMDAFPQCDDLGLTMLFKVTC